MDTLPMTIPNNTKVIIELPEGEFTGTIMGNGYQSQELKYFILLDNPASYPNLPPDEMVAIVPTTIVKIDVSKMEL